MTWSVPALFANVDITALSLACRSDRCLLGSLSSIAPELF